MPVKYSIDPACGQVFSTGWGVISAKELTAQTKRLLRDQDFSSQYRQLWDLTDVIRFSASFPEMLAVAQLDVFAPNARRAILAPGNATFGIARMFQMLREAKGETGIRVFRDRAEALQWLESVVPRSARAKK